MTKEDWRKKLHYDLHTDIASGSKLEGASEKEINKAYKKVTSQLYHAFKGTEIKFRGKKRQTDIYAEAYRIIIGIETTTQSFFNENFDLEITSDFEKNYVNKRLENFADSYEEVKAILGRYNKGEITLDQLKNDVEQFKKTNAKYLSQEYKSGHTVRSRK